MASTQLHGMGQYVKRLEAIADQCGEKKTKLVEEKDEFSRLKAHMYQLLEEVREDIRERTALLKKRGNCHDTIQKGHRIRQGLDELKRSLPKLQELHKRAQGKRGAGKRQDELQSRYADMRAVKKQVDEANELFMSANAGMEMPNETLTSGASAKLFGLRDAARANPEDTKRLLSAEEEEVMSHIKKRDQGIDDQIDQLGQVIDRMDPMAKEIGIMAERQKDKADAMAVDVEKADKDIQAINKRITEVMRYEKNTTCCCQMVLGVVLLCCVGFVFQQLSL